MSDAKLLQAAIEMSDALHAYEMKLGLTYNLPNFLDRAWENLSVAIEESRALSPSPADGCNSHHWKRGLVSSHPEWDCCQKCGIIRRADDQNKPCKGIVKVELRTPAPADEK